jgi:hypothetical protein
MARDEDQRRRRDERRATAVREDHGLEVIGHRHPPVLPPADADIPYDEPEQFGLRIVFQSEQERLEAAEFLVATRVQEDAKLRANRELEELRHREES